MPKREKLTEEEKKEKIRQYKRTEYLKNAETIKARQRDYYIKKKIERGEPLKNDKYKISILHINDCKTDEEKKRFVVSFE
jgi:hypothetical protein